METILMSVRHVEDEAIDIKRFELVRVDGGTLPPFTPGSHIDVHVGDVIRQYSLCNGPDERDDYVIAVKREVESRGGSRTMHDSVRVGDTLSISAPRNNFPLVADASHHLLLAGGIGITPLMSMARYLRAQDASFKLLYFSRSISHTAFHSLLSQPQFSDRVGFHYALDPAGLKTYLRKILWERASGAHLYVCGPRPFIELVQDTAAPTWSPDSVHVEYFAARAEEVNAPGQSFEVELARTGTRCIVPEEVSIVSALAAIGVHVDISCQQGVCGTCLTGVLGGEPDHRDAFLTDEERAANDKIMPCVSRARSPSLILDL